MSSTIIYTLLVATIIVLIVLSATLRRKLKACEEERDDRVHRGTHDHVLNIVRDLETKNTKLTTKLREAEATVQVLEEKSRADSNKLADIRKETSLTHSILVESFVRETYIFKNTRTLAERLTAFNEREKHFIRIKAINAEITLKGGEACTTGLRDLDAVITKEALEKRLGNKINEVVSINSVDVTNL